MRSRRALWWAVAMLPAALLRCELLAAATPATVATEAPATLSDADAQALRSLALVVPVAGVARAHLHDTYSESRGGRPHAALDIPAARGTPVIAATSGRIAKLFHSVPGGLTLYQFDPDERFALYYAHLDAYAPDLREGVAVTRGQVIGYVGTTGNAPADAPHLHFAVIRLGPEKRWWQGTPIDPFAFLNDP